MLAWPLLHLMFKSYLGVGLFQLRREINNDIIRLKMNIIFIYSIITEINICILPYSVYNTMFRDNQLKLCKRHTKQQLHDPMTFLLLKEIIALSENLWNDHSIKPLHLNFHRLPFVCQRFKTWNAGFFFSFFFFCILSKTNWSSQDEIGLRNIFKTKQINRSP